MKGICFVRFSESDLATRHSQSSRVLEVCRDGLAKSNNNDRSTAIARFSRTQPLARDDGGDGSVVALFFQTTSLSRVLDCAAPVPSRSIIAVGLPRRAFAPHHHPAMRLTAAAQMASAKIPTAFQTASAPMFVDLCTNVAPFAAILVFMAPFPTIQRVREEKNVGTLPLLPYSSMAASAFIWTTYGLLRGEPKIWSSNVIGLSLGLYYMFHFIKHAPKSAPTLPGTVRQHVGSVLAVFTSTIMVAMSPAMNPAALIGPFGLALTIAMFGSPLSALKTVVQTKSAASIPLPFTIASLTNCLAWSVAGLFRMKDFNIYFPNLLGLSFSIAQVALKLTYGDGVKGRPAELPM